MTVHPGEMQRTVGTYDYVVVGAGSAGCVMANRLTERSDRSGLVLEAGEPNDRREIDIPLALGELMRSSADWEYYTEPQAECAGRRLYWPRGKTLGGSSSINAMIYIRGHPADTITGPTSGTRDGATRSCSRTSERASTSSRAGRSTTGWAGG